MRWLQFFTAILFAVIFIIACQRGSETQEAAESPYVSQQLLQDTTATAPDTSRIEIDEFEKYKSELERQVAELLTTLEERRQELNKQELLLLEERNRLDTLSADLTQREAKMRTQRMLSWFSFVFGVIGIAFGVIMAIRYRKTARTAEQLPAGGKASAVKEKEAATSKKSAAPAPKEPAKKAATKNAGDGNDPGEPESAARKPGSETTKSKSENKKE